jgi:hypothetical protein
MLLQYAWFEVFNFLLKQTAKSREEIEMVLLCLSLSSQVDFELLSNVRQARVTAARQGQEVCRFYPDGKGPQVQQCRAGKV